MQERKRLHLEDYDYSTNGIYFITVCIQKNENTNRQNISVFGEVQNGKMEINEYGKIIKECWEWLEKQYEYVKLDVYSIMPNHFHGILILNSVKNDSADSFQVCSLKSQKIKPI
jgi:putative transposase